MGIRAGFQVWVGISLEGVWGHVTNEGLHLGVVENQCELKPGARMMSTASMSKTFIDLDGSRILCPQH